MSNPYNDWEELLAADPAAGTVAIAMAAAQQAAAAAVEEQTGPLIQAAWENARAETEALEEGQRHVAFLEADRALNAKYGAEWRDSRDAIVETINQEEGLLPAAMRLNPEAVVNRLELVFLGTRESQRQKREQEAFDRIKNSGYKTYADLAREEGR